MCCCHSYIKDVLYGASLVKKLYFCNHKKQKEGIFALKKYRDMTYEEAINKLYEQFPAFSKVGASAMKAGLDNSIELDKWLDYPHKSFKSIHVAGTNGKGSTSHTLCSILMSAGYKVGLYTSPHLVDFRERIRVDGKMIEKDEVVAFVERAEREMPKVDPSFFEITMMMAFDYFRKCKVDVAVIEVGLGGRLDSTNIITPDLSVITNIGLEHTQLLGSTLGAIAGEKAGIMKPGVPVVIGERHPETDCVFMSKALEAGSPIIFAQDMWHVDWAEDDIDMLALKMSNCCGGRDAVHYALTGLCQQKNVVTVMAAVDVLRKVGYEITGDALRSGLRKVVSQTGLVGRWQKISSKPDMIIDTGHNAHGVRLVAQQLLKACSEYGRVHIVWGMANDKRPEDVVPMLPKQAKYYFCSPGVERAFPVSELKKIGEKCGFECESYESVREALSAAKKNAVANDLIFIGGSNFVIAEIL